jgi:benzoyl-CoA reductase subunit BamC
MLSKNPIPVSLSNAICVKTDPPQEKPLCVQWCMNDVLSYEEREEEVEEEEKLGDMEIGLESLVDKYGLQTIMDTVARMSKKG